MRRGKTPDYYNPATGRDDDGNLIMNIASYGQEFLDHASSGEFGEQTTYLEGAVSYSREFGKHYVDAMLLYNQRSYDTGEKLPYRNRASRGVSPTPTTAAMSPSSISDTTVRRISPATTASASFLRWPSAG